MKENRIINWFKFLVAIFPIMIFAFAVFRSGTYDFESLSTQLLPFCNTGFFKPFYEWLTDFLGTGSNNFTIIIFGFFVYLFYYEFISLLFDFICFIIRFGRKWLNGMYK